MAGKPLSPPLLPFPFACRLHLFEQSVILRRDHTVLVIGPEEPLFKLAVLLELVHKGSQGRDLAHLSRKTGVHVSGGLVAGNIIHPAVVGIQTAAPLLHLWQGGELLGPPVFPGLPEGL